MIPYSEFRPTQFDIKGLGLPERQDWLVVDKVARTRDSSPATSRNFDRLVSRLEKADPEGVEVHKFGHWGPGWYEIILVKPGSKAARIV